MTLIALMLVVEIEQVVFTPVGHMVRKHHGNVNIVLNIMDLVIVFVITEVFTIDVLTADNFEIR